MTMFNALFCSADIRLDFTTNLVSRQMRGTGEKHQRRNVEFRLLISSFLSQSLTQHEVFIAWDAWIQEYREV